jgi:mono/diheme cytochrome c family protein
MMASRNKVFIRMYIRLVFLYAMIVLVTSCSSPTPPTATSDTAKTTTQPASLEDDPGYALYKKHCLACHQHDGSGVPAMFPPLAKNPMVAGDPGEVIGTVLNGKTGKVEVNGEIYSGMMAPFKHLPDEEIVLLVNFVRSRYGSVTTPVTTADVKKEREKQGTK